MNYCKILPVFLVLLSCTAPKMATNPALPPTEKFPLDYALALPSLEFSQWDHDYDAYDHLLTKKVRRTQIGLSYENKGVITWTCFPSARPYTQLDTLTMISDPKQLQGTWISVCGRSFVFEDSARLGTRKIYRSSRLTQNITDERAAMVFKGKRLAVYARKTGESQFQRLSSSNFQLENRRYLLSYGLSKRSAAVSFAGIDREGRLIINTYGVEERRTRNGYITYESNVKQVILRREGSAVAGL